MLKFIFFLFVLVNLAFASSFEELHVATSGVKLKKLKKMIRPCCNFGYGMPFKFFPLFKLNYITTLSELGNHKYFGSSKEKNGIIYSKKGGFLDLGHIRDNADLVLYFTLMIDKFNGHNVSIPMVNEGGERILHLNLENKLSFDDAIILSQRIAYETAVWHEIRTYYGIPTYFGIKEVQSAFSPEDNYSNLLGTYIGAKALRRNMTFEKAMDIEIEHLFQEFEGVLSFQETKDAMDAILGIWWQKIAIPNYFFLLKRQFQTYQNIDPVMAFNETETISISVPETLNNGQKLTDLFTLEIYPDRRIPMSDFFSEEKITVNEDDFQHMINVIKVDHEFRNNQRYF